MNNLIINYIAYPLKSLVRFKFLAIPKFFKELQDYWSYKVFRFNTKMIKGYKVYNKWIKVVSKNYKNKDLDMKNLYSMIKVITLIFF